ncbi:hypothetical protein BDW69DRAFT_181529 [Aspergillus filifer]
MTAPIPFNSTPVLYNPGTYAMQALPPTILPSTMAQTAPPGKIALPRQGINGQPIYQSPERDHKRYNRACAVCRDRKRKCSGGKRCIFCSTNNFVCQYPKSKRDGDRKKMEELEQRVQEDKALLKIVASEYGISVEELRRRKLGDRLTCLSPQPGLEKPKKSNKRKRSEVDEDTDSSSNETVTSNTLSAGRPAPVAPVAPPGPLCVPASSVAPQPASTPPAPPLVSMLDQGRTRGGPTFVSGPDFVSGFGSAPGEDSWFV